MDSMSDLRWDRPTLGHRDSRKALARQTKFLVGRGCRCSYKHMTVSMKGAPFPSWMDKLMQACMPACGLTDPSLWPNSCLLNGYVDGKEGIDWHSDDEPLF